MCGLHHIHLTLRFPECSLLQLSSAIIETIELISKTYCPLLPVACEVNFVATSDVLLPGCNSGMALFAALHTLSQSAFLRQQILL